MEISTQASLISLTLPGTTYPILLAFALINALTKRQASKPRNKQTSISDQFGTPWNYVSYSSRICVDQHISETAGARQANQFLSKFFFKKGGNKQTLLQRHLSCQHALYVAHAATPTTVISARRSINTRAATEMGGSDRSCVGSLLRSNKAV